MGHGETLVDLIKERHIEKFAEIGIWKCRLCKFILRACSDQIKEYWAIDRWQRFGPGYGHYTNLPQEKWDDLHAYAAKLMFFWPQIRILRMDSILAAGIFEKGYLDAVYIDSDHYYDAVVSDIRTWLPVVRKNGFLCGHDYGTHRHREVKPAVNDILGENNISVAPGAVWIYEKRI